MGRFDFGFIRQDATINLEAQTSDLELAIDSTEKRSEGDVYVERDISRAGMNGFELGRDFSLDDIVRYRVWGNYLRLPVTAGDLESSVDGGLRGVRVHVGGQVASDSEARLRRNAEILGQLENEKRQRTRQVSKAQSTATSAKSTAEQAKQTADETAALVDGLDIDGSIQEAREAVDSSNAILQLVRQLTGAAAAQGAQAQASASLAIEYARQAEEVLDKLDPLRDDVVASHAEVARLSGEAAKAAQDAASAVARGEKQVVAAQRAANAAAQDAATAEGLVDEAKGLLQELGPLQDAARKSLADAQDLLDNAGGSGRSLSDVLKDVAAKHQEVLSAHDDILATHGEILEIHGEAIRYAAMAAAQAGAAAMQASQAASEALRAADLNAQAIAALAEADEKLAEADRKLQEQIDVLEESQRLLAQAVRYVAAAAAQAAQAAMSAAQASEENANAIEQTNVAVDAAADSVEALKKASAARDEVMGNIQKSVNSASAAASSLEKSQAAFEDTLLIQQNAIFWGEVHRTRIFDKYSMTTVTDNELMTMTPIESDRKLRLDFKGIWGGRVQVIGRMVDAWGKNSRVDFFSYGAGPGYRRLIVEPEVVNYGVDKVHVVVDMWWPNRALEFVFVPKAGGGWETPPYEDSIQGGVNLGLMHEGTMIVYWPRGKGYRASRAVQVSPDDGRTWKTYSAGALLPASASIGGYQVTGIRPVRGDTRPVKLTEQI
ncbi:hypothetical protein [Corynebacterium sp. Marseille-P4611]|uniref:hypothetical protein n=1 Tax=Corynebacterium sp. Marseille-P4611 TaxID=2866575 RepID=UPI001CE3BA83|nr:hypothetical protein [Corynebacterium sp. Marseille-P4611]